MREYVVKYTNKGPVEVTGTILAENADELKDKLVNNSDEMVIEGISFENAEGEYTVVEEREPETEYNSKINPIIEVQEWTKQDIMYYIKHLGYPDTEENFNKVMEYNNSEIKDWIRYHYDEQIANIEAVISEALGGK